jgi:hypothetical protein
MMRRQRLDKINSQDEQTQTKLNLTDTARTERRRGKYCHVRSPSGTSSKSLQIKATSQYRDSDILEFSRCIRLHARCAAAAIYIRSQCQSQDLTRSSHQNLADELPTYVNIDEICDVQQKQNKQIASFRHRSNLGDPISSHM